MSRLVTLLSTVALTACVAEAVTLPASDLGATLTATLAAAETVLARPAVIDPGRGPWANVADLAFLPGGGGVVESGSLKFSWQLNLRNLGLDHDGVEADLIAAAEALGGLDLGACEVAELDLYEVETDFANERGRFELAMEPGAGQVLVGVYDPRSLEPGLGAVVLTPLGSARERRALVAHELAHHVHFACHIGGDSEAFAESVEGLFNTARTPQRVASVPTRSAPPVAAGLAAEPAPAPVVLAVAQPAPAAVRARAMRRNKASRAKALRARAAHQGR